MTPSHCSPVLVAMTSTAVTSTMSLEVLADLQVILPSHHAYTEDIAINRIKCILCMFVYCTDVQYFIFI